MTYSFIHLSEIEQNSFTLHRLKDDKSIKSISASVDDLAEHFDNNSTCIIFLSSKYFNYKSYKNELNLKKELLQATVLNEVEESIISNISELDFQYDRNLELGIWADKALTNGLNKKFNVLPGNFIILPEHFLLGNKQNRILLNKDYFCASFQDNTGFSGTSDALNQFLDIIDEDISTDSIEMISFDQNIQNLESAEKKILHIDSSILYLTFIESLANISLNFFHRSFSFNYLKSRVNLNKFDTRILALASLVIMLAPLISSSFLKSHSDSYKAMTLEVFQQLNPNFNRVVNSRAQINDLTRDLPKQEGSNLQNLDMLSYIKQINDEAIKKVEINIIDKQIIVQIENLSSIKYKIFQELFSQPNLDIDSSRLSNINEFYTGDLIINYVS